MMSYYPPKIAEKFRAPVNAGGSVGGANGVGTGATFVCGAVLRFTLRIENPTREIEEARFQTSGCGYAIAAADVLAQHIIGKRLAQLHGLEREILRREIERRLDVFDESRKHCLELVIDALEAAFADYRAAQIKEWAGEKALICTCFGVSEETIERVIEEQSLTTIEEVTEACNAGGGCGSCQPLIADLLDSRRRERYV